MSCLVAVSSGRKFNPTIVPMHIVLTGALPDARAARALLPQFTRTAPALARWLARGRACVHAVSVQQTGCTAEEWWRLRQHGFQANAQQNCAAGLGVLRWHEALASNAVQTSHPAPDQPVWLAELVHIAPTQHGAGLLTASELNVSQAHDRALFDSLHDLNKSGDFTLHQLMPGVWRVAVLTADFSLPTASAALVARTSVNDWWPQQEAARPWRRLFNEVQMTWFDHPVNQQRQQQGLPAVNGLWLFGGAAPDQFANLAAPASMHWHDDCLQPLLHQDWPQWLQALAHLDKTLQDALDANAVRQLDLIGQSRVVTITPQRTHWLAHLKNTLTGSAQAWKKWWSDQD